MSLLLDWISSVKHLTDDNNSISGHNLPFVKLLLIY